MSGKRIINKIKSTREIGVLIALVLLFVLFAVTSTHFLRIENLLNVIRQISLFGIIALGMTFVIVAGEIDLSVAGIYAFSAIIAGLMMTAGVPIPIAVIVSLIAGTLIGFINGLLVTLVGIPSLIATLGVVNIARGGALILSGNRPISINYRTVKDGFLDGFLFAGQGKLAGVIPMIVIFFILLIIIFYFVFNKTAYGYHIRAVGGNRFAAIASGISEKKVKIVAFSITGFLCSIAGLLSLSFMASVQSTVGRGIELEVIAAVIIGGTSMAGGEGTIIGSIIGVLIMGVLKNGLVLLGISPFWSLLSVGVVIIVASSIDILSKKSLGIKRKQ